MCAGIHPHPGPQGPDLSTTFVQFNCSGLFSSKTELQNYIVNHQVKIVALQETKLNAKSKHPNFQGYNLVRKDRPVGRGGGLAFLIHESVRFTNLDVSSLIQANDLTIELQGISAFINNSEIKIFNVYIPPASANPTYSPDISKILEVGDDALILGDFNAHDGAWHSSLSDSRGNSLVQQIEISDFFILNSDSHTRCPPNGATTSPDLSLISVHLALSVSWSTDTTLNSDHLPICINFIDDQPPPE
jgi:hypothetical protein